MPKKRTKCEYSIFNPQRVHLYPHIHKCGDRPVTTFGTKVLCSRHLQMEQNKQTARIDKVQAGVGRYGKD